MRLLGAVKASLALLDDRDRRKLALAVVIQMATSLLDLVGVLLLGLVGALAVTTLQMQPAPAPVIGIVDAIGLSDLSDQAVLALFCVIAASVLLLKSVLSSLLLRRVFVFLAGRQAVVSSRLARQLLSRPLPFVQRRSSQETAYALTQGAGAATLGMLGQAVVFVSESCLLIVMGLTLLLVDPIVALSSIAFFALVALTLQFTLGNWAATAGREVSVADVASLDAIQEVINAYREISVADRRATYVARIEALRWQAARGVSDLQFVAALPKYVFEVALVLGGFILAAAMFTTQTTAVAVGTLALFFAAATRVMPSILRLQTAAIAMRNAESLAMTTLELAESLKVTAGREVLPRASSRAEAGQLPRFTNFTPHVEMEHVSYRYPGSSLEAIDDVSISVPAGYSLALVGSSGAGKSTLVDLLLGVLEPDRGSARISGVAAPEATRRWPGAIAYVPQSVVIANASVRANVALGIPDEEIDDDRVWDALRRGHIADELSMEGLGLDTPVGERGLRLSGGQRQRLGIARALYSRPQLLVLDEATSALDAETEMSIGRTIEELEGEVTVVVVAHRLSTVRAADEVVYLERGRALARGTFDEVRKLIPAFETQASLMGLK